jgi:3-(3-hydroxy-phenyl)propionate hydroxylase
MSAQQTDVLIVGAGPSGMTMANLLGVYGTRALVIDREAGILQYPRAVGIDDESLRTYQAVGLVERVLNDLIQNVAIRYHTSWGRCFAEVKPSARPFGWSRRNLFMQPLLEEVLRDGVTRYPTIETRYGCVLQSLSQDATGVTAHLCGADGAVQQVRARYLVGADGGRSTVRDQLGIVLTGKTQPVKWLVVDVADDQLDAPYSAVYCHSDQPVLVVPLPYGHRRFEFRLQHGDDDEAAVRPERIDELLRSRYGATPLPTVLRARVYLHHSRIAETFQRGRAFLVGDAAHLQPPFFGQGMNSGIRDVTNLAWKLAAVVSGQVDERLLTTYDAERRSHAREMVQFATRIGAMYRPRNIVTERFRDLVFRALQLVPGGKEYILQMKYKPMPRYTDGVVIGVNAKDKNDPIGRMFNQPMVELADGAKCRLDDAVGPWFAVIGVQVDPASLDVEAVQFWRSLGARFVHVEPSRASTRRGPAAAGAELNDTLVLEDVDGAFRDWRLARPNAEIIVLRPDRYLAAMCDRSGFAAMTRSTQALLSEGVNTRHA